MTNNNQNLNGNNSGGPVRRSRFNFTSNRPQQSLAPEHQHLARDPEPDKRPRSRKSPKAEKSGPLIFNVSTLLHEHEGSHRDYEFEQDRLQLTEEEGEKPEEATNIKGEVRLTKVRHDILAQGRAEAEVVLECVRCLRDFDQHVEVELEDIYHPTIDLLTGLPVKTEIPEEEADLKLDDNHLLNLGEALRQQILVSLPINPVCGDDCPGYQATLDRINSSSTLPDSDEAEEAEEEADTPVDKRWSALSKLLENDDPDKNLN